MKLLTLFFSFLQIGAFSFGGGYAALPLIQHQEVDLKYQQMSIIQNILKYIRPAVVSLIAVSGLLIIVSCFFGDTVNFANLKFGSVAIFIVALVLLRKQKMNPITVMVIAGIIQIGLYYIGIS